LSGFPPLFLSISYFYIFHNKTFYNFIKKIAAIETVLSEAAAPVFNSTGYIRSGREFYRKNTLGLARDG